MKSGPEGPVERFDKAQRWQGHALRVGRKAVLARSLDWQVASATCLHSLTPMTAFSHHHGLTSTRPEPSSDELARQLEGHALGRVVGDFLGDLESLTQRVENFAHEQFRS